MNEYVEWRHNNAYDTVLVTDEDHRITSVYTVGDKSGLDALRHALTDLGDLDDWHGDPIDPDAENPGDYGDLVLQRAACGTVTDLNPKLFAERLAFWFRGR